MLQGNLRVMPWRVPRDDDALPMLLPFPADLQVEAWEEIPRALWI